MCHSGKRFLLDAILQSWNVVCTLKFARSLIKFLKLKHRVYLNIRLYCLLLKYMSNIPLE